MRFGKTTQFFSFQFSEANVIAPAAIFLEIFSSKTSCSPGFQHLSSLRPLSTAVLIHKEIITITEGLGQTYNLDRTDKPTYIHKFYYIFVRIFFLVSRLTNNKAHLIHHGSTCLSTKLDFDAGAKWSLYVLCIFISQKLYSMGTFTYRGGPTRGLEDDCPVPR